MKLRFDKICLFPSFVHSEPPLAFELFEILFLIKELFDEAILFLQPHDPLIRLFVAAFDDVICSHMLTACLSSQKVSCIAFRCHHV